MTGKRCTDCRHTKGIGYDFWCGEGHTEYEVFGAETNCPYYEYHDWSKGIPSKTVKRFEVTFNDTDFHLKDNETGEELKLVDEKVCYDYIADRWNALHEENEDFKSFNKDLAENLSTCANARISKDNRIERLEEKIQRERTSFTKTHERWSKEAETKIKELSEENEQLKKENKELQDTIETICKDFEESHGMDIRNADWFTAW